MEESLEAELASLKQQLVDQAESHQSQART